MRTLNHLLSVGACALALVIAKPALAQETGTRTYAVSYKQVANDCDQTSLNLRDGEVTLTSTNGKEIRVRIAGVAPMKGAQRAGGKFKAQANGKPNADGIRGKFSVSGRARANGTLQMVFIAEFYRGKRPLCTQSWSARGTRK